MSSHRATNALVAADMHSASVERPSRSRRAPERFAPAAPVNATAGHDAASPSVLPSPRNPIPAKAKGKSKKAASDGQSPPAKRIRRGSAATPAPTAVDSEEDEGFVVLPPPPSTSVVPVTASTANPALESLAARFTTAPSPPPAASSDDASTLAALAAQVAALAAAVTALTNKAAPDRAGVHVLSEPFSLPVELSNAPSLGAAEYPRAKIKGGYYPPEDHLFRAHRLYKILHSTEGKTISPHSVALMLCCQAKFPFRTSPALAMAQFSGRLGSLGASVMCFLFRGQRQSLRHNSSNYNMTLSFDPSASLPADSCSPCENLNQLSDAVDGLANFADVHWLQYTQPLFSALRRFVSAVKADEDRPLQCVTDLAVDFVNKWLGATLDALGSDTPTWWTDYQSAVDGISATSSEYLVAYIQVTSAHRQSDAGGAAKGAPTHKPAHHTGHAAPAQPYQPMPEHVKALIPKNTQGDEPCLRRMIGKACSVNCSRAHDWDTVRDGAVDPTLLTWAKQNLVDRRSNYNSSKPRHRGRRT